MKRFPEHKVFDYCLNPLHIFNDGEDVIVPCGHCDGCRVHAANVWSMRLGQEIQDCPNALFVTLTYYNRFLPKLRVVSDSYGLLKWSSNHRDNWRFAGNRCSLREDDIEIIGNYEPIAVTNFDAYECIPYASKRDIQLWLKLIRKQLDNENITKEPGQKYFRYFIISEYGETKYRPHYHAIFFPSSREIAERLLYPSTRDKISGAFFENWQMCDQDRFEEFCTYCDSGTSPYLTQYVNSISRLPKVYKDNALRPFRLSSKSPSIGYGSYNRENIIEGLIEGNYEYVRTIKRLTDKYVLRYSKDYLFSTFPKCVGYGKKSFDELLFTYGSCYRNFQFSNTPDAKSDHFGLPFLLRSSDYNASRKCLQICNSLGCTPFHYCYLLDMAWYLNDMYALKLFYQYQELKGNILDCFYLYQNISDYLQKDLTQQQIFAFDLFCDGFDIDPLDFQSMSPEQVARSSRPDDAYVAELADIITNMVKMPKLNESLGVSPVILY